MTYEIENDAMTHVRHKRESRLEFQFDYVNGTKFDFETSPVERSRSQNRR